ncbi:MAG: hypothetical protein AAB782_02085 [Patescibacteria group bacterium]
MNKFWTIEKIKEGFERFRNEYGRLPMAPEIDKLEYLPSSRWIQKKLGGLEKLRSQLGYQDIHFGKGVFRSKIATRVNNRGRNVELALEKILREKFGEVFVHTERIFDTSKNRVDFYVYSPDGNFGIDIFYTETMRYLQSNINIKINKYHNFPLQLFLVVANKNFRQEDLDKYANLKIKPMSQTTKIVTLETLLNFLKSKKVYPNPMRSINNEKFHGGRDINDKL